MWEKLRSRGYTRKDWNLEGNFSRFGSMTYPITIHHQVFFCLVFPPDSVGILAVSCAKSGDVELDH
jgi:hypothetical protein